VAWWPQRVICRPSARRVLRPRAHQRHSVPPHFTSVSNPVSCIEDEPPHILLVRYERLRLDAADRLADVVLQIGEGFWGLERADSRLLLDVPLRIVVPEGLHPAVGVVDEHDPARAQQSLDSVSSVSVVSG
jgi:hypothetical protein